jgi:hypothetical protein
MNENDNNGFINIFKALADFQQECPVIHKGTTGYGYTYADLPQILEVINPLLKKHSLGFTQMLEGSGLRTILFHTKSGQYLESYCDIPATSLKGMNDFQAIGSGITYFRRYALSGILGIVSDKDTDAAGEKEKPHFKETKLPAFVKKHKSITDLTLAIDSCENLNELSQLHALNKDLINPAITALFTTKKNHLN